MGEAKCSGCRKKNLDEHHCRDWVEREQPKMVLRCTCPCHGKADIEERIKSNDEMERIGREHSRNFRLARRR